MPDQQKSLTLRKCQHCGDEFEPIRVTKRFCGTSCRVAAFNKRRRLEFARQFRLEQRRAVSLGFDGRLGGKLRDVGCVPKKSAGRPSKCAFSGFIA